MTCSNQKEIICKKCNVPVMVSEYNYVGVCMRCHSAWYNDLKAMEKIDYCINNKILEKCNISVSRLIKLGYKLEITK